MLAVDKVVEKPFLFGFAEHVQWSGDPLGLDTSWQVIQQRLTVTMATQLKDYLLIPVNDSHHAPVWVCEPDLAPWHARQG